MPDEGLPLLVLVRARTFADEEPIGVLGADAEDRLLALLAQAARRTRAHRLAQRMPVERGDASRRGCDRAAWRCGRDRGWLRLQRVEPRERGDLELLESARIDHNVRPRKSASSRPLAAG